LAKLTISKLKETPYQDDELLQLQVVLHVDSNFIHYSFVDVDGEGEEITINLLNETNIDEEYEGKYISSESVGDIDSDFDDTDTSSVIDALKLIVYLVLIMIYINMIMISNSCNDERQENQHIWL